MVHLKKKVTLRTKVTDSEASPKVTLRTKVTDSEVKPKVTLKTKVTDSEASPKVTLRTKVTDSEVKPKVTLKTKVTDSEASPKVTLRTKVTDSEVKPKVPLKTKVTDSEVKPKVPPKTKVTDSEVSPKVTLRTKVTDSEVKPKVTSKTKVTDSEAKPKAVLRSKTNDSEVQQKESSPITDLQIPVNKSEGGNKRTIWFMGGLGLLAVILFFVFAGKNGEESTSTETVIAEVKPTQPVTSDEVTTKNVDSTTVENNDNTFKEEPEIVTTGQSPTVNKTNQSAQSEISKNENKPQGISSSPSVDSIEQKAVTVIRGTYGNGLERKQKLGDEYAVIQNKVNEMYRAGLVD